jgi:uncharacterized protein YfbU (UPF0304 family)
MKWMGKIRGSEEIAVMSTDLPDILRFAISPQEFVTLDAETRILDRYIEIQRIRQSGALSFRLEIPEELEACFDEMDTEAGRKVLGGADAALADALEDPETWLKNNREIIERYLAFQKTEEYKNSPGAKLMELLKRFNEEQGYNSIFIPAMRRLSPAYDAYLTKLHEADRVFLSGYQSF